MPGFLSPYRATRYHLNEVQGRLPESPREIFNHQHFSLRNAVERVFGVLKSDGPFLMPPNTLTFLYKIVVACCVLHNHIMGVDPFDQVTRKGIREADRHVMVDEVEDVDNDPPPIIANTKTPSE
uniref:DDE Tnp4 domain-containing protein n=1 Tax=Nelumbo nucifera TaxID=4432 RepID=A0A822YVH5_NELNU|nr:TPA_asm: hypothetical protein HUJ06_007323 [Nelumbo nucifera]